ncbi:MAG: ATP-binding protein, partial [Armatimonadota bacterium]
DAVRLEEVLINLISNAAKYTPSGGTIELNCEVTGEHARIRVRDNGVGIDEDLLPWIFDLFTQADRSLDRSEGGLGIGLSLAQGLITILNGTIQAFSPPPNRTQGSEFVVCLPLIAPPVAAPPVEPSEAMPQANGLRALLVDDNLDLVTLLSSILRSKGYEIQTAHNGLEGLAMAKEWKPDIALLDIGMPGLGGFEVARALREEFGGTMRLLALTGYGYEEDVVMMREAGFDGHLIKPFDINELERLMMPVSIR